MTSSRRLDLTTRARRDFRSILRYNRKTWGDHQRDVYASRLESAMTNLLQFPFLGEARDEVSLGLRRFLVAPHVIFYRVDDAAVTIIRILHERMDIPARLGNVRS